MAIAKHGKTWVAVEQQEHIIKDNSTGKPIMVFVIYTVGTNADIDFHYTPAGGSEIQGAGLYTNASNGRAAMSLCCSQWRSIQSSRFW